MTRYRCIPAFALLAICILINDDLFAAGDATVSVEASVILGPVNRHILGNNIYFAAKGRQKRFFERTGGGLWDPATKSFDSAYLKLIKQAGVSVLRWPGGPWPDYFDWRKLVGPPEDRPNHTFGLPEFLSLCQEIGALPVITLPTRLRQQEQIPGLIEYLNTPNDGSNLNGGVEWAKTRSGDGRDRPWGVTWFEFGNETFGTNTSPEEYVSSYKKVYDQVTAIDSNILLGAVLEDSDNISDGWNKKIITMLGDKMGFAIIHPYYPEVKEREAEHYSMGAIAKSTMASDELFIARLRDINELLRSETGRNDLYLAATEYNGNFVQNDPIRFRFTLFNAIHNADFVRIMLDPASNILFANHWHLVNSYWGMVREPKGKGEPLIKQANYYVYELYNRYLSDNLVGLKIESPSYYFEGAGVIPAREGSSVDGTWKKYSGTLPGEWSLRLFSDVEQRQDKGVVTVTFKNMDEDYYHAYKSFNVKPNTLYRVSVKIKANDIVGGKVGIAVEDVRGWKKTFNQPSNIQLKGMADWQWVTAQIRTLPDAEKLRVVARRLKGKGPISGIAEFGDIRVEENESKLGEVKSVVGIATKSEDGAELDLVLLNKDIDQSVKTSIKIPGGYKIDDAVVLQAPTPYSSNYAPVSTENVKVNALEYRIDAADLKIELPPSSMAGIRFITF